MTNHRIALTTLLAAAYLLAGFSGARADIASDRAAAILIFPRVIVSGIRSGSPESFNFDGADTVIQISNTTNDPVSLHCFYVNANSHCSFSGQVCDPEHEIHCPLDADLCLPNWTETDFHVDVTGQQPLVWKASAGLSGDEFPLDGVALRGPTGQSNAGSAVPPVQVDTIGEFPGVQFFGFQGELKCIVVDGSGRAIANNAVKGEATIETEATEFAATGAQFQEPSVEKYNAIGIQAIDGDANGDGVLELGGEAGEYNGCPNVLIVNHFFDFPFILTSSAMDSLPPEPGSFQAPQSTAPLITISELTLVPCNQDFRLQVPGRTVAQFLVFNEFEQRFSTSRTVDCFFRHFLSLIDTNDPERSIFSTAVAGTTVGQTRIRGVSGGLLGVLSEVNPLIAPFTPFGGMDDAVNLHFQGDREAPDRIVLP